MIVTVYRKDGTVVRLNAHFTVKKGLETDRWGTSQKDRFNCIVMGSADLRPGDRILMGAGPETVDWESFVPELAGCYRVEYVQPFFWQGQVHHVEAGGGYD